MKSDLILNVFIIISIAKLLLDSWNNSGFGGEYEGDKREGEEEDDEGDEVIGKECEADEDIEGEGEMEEKEEEVAKEMGVKSVEEEDCKEGREESEEEEGGGKMGIWVGLLTWIFLAAVRTANTEGGSGEKEWEERNSGKRVAGWDEVAEGRGGREEEDDDEEDEMEEEEIVEDVEGGGEVEWGMETLRPSSGMSKISCWDCSCCACL